MMQPTPRSDQTSLVFAILAILLAVFALSLGDAIIKSISASFSLWQIYVLRSLLVLPILISFMRLRRPDIGLLPNALSWAILRSLLLAAMWVAYYTSLPHLSLPVAAAAYYTLPIFITLFSARLSGEPVSTRGWIATVAGFVGVVIILRPDAGGVTPYALLPILAAVLYAFAMILTRTKCRDDHPIVLSIALNATFVVFGVVATVLLFLVEPDVPDNLFLFGPWAALDAMGGVALIVLAAAMLIGSVFAGYAYQNGPPAIVSTFDYGYLVFSVFWGIVFFADIPDFMTLTGIGIVALAGILASTGSRRINHPTSDELA